MPDEERVREEDREKKKEMGRNESVIGIETEREGEKDGEKDGDRGRERRKSEINYHSGGKNSEKCKMAGCSRDRRDSSWHALPLGALRGGVWRGGVVWCGGGRGVAWYSEAWRDVPRQAHRGAFCLFCAFLCVFAARELHMSSLTVWQLS